MTMKKQRHAKTKNSRKCEKKMFKSSKPQVFFSENYIYDPLNVFAKTMGAIKIG